MSKNTNLEVSENQNFILRGSNSIQIGIYIIITAFVINTLLNGFINDNSFVGMLSIQIIEVFGLVFSFLTILLSALAILFSNRRYLRKQGIQLWNKESKKIATSYFLFFIPMITFGTLLLKNGLIKYIPILVLISIGTFLTSFNTEKKKERYLISGICLLLAVITFMIPTYWYASLMILGGSFFVYGVMVRN